MKKFNTAIKILSLVFVFGGLVIFSKHFTNASISSNLRGTILFEQNQNIISSLNDPSLIDSAKSDIKAARTCVGQWLYFHDTLVELDYSELNDWRPESKPSILTETLTTKNTVITGHNLCKNGNCNKPATDFAKIINLKEGDKVMLCLNNLLYTSKVIVSKPVDETAVQILGNWLNDETFTAFTCYGKCNDAQCSSSKERWVIAFKKSY